VNCVEMDFPKEHLGLGDKLILPRHVRELAEEHKYDINYVTSYAFTVEVRLYMRDNYGYKTKKIFA
jgi:hypothetical protein